MNCTYTPPAGQDIAPYLSRVLLIISQLNDTKNRETAKQRLQLLIDDVKAVIDAAK
jgi:hypothetical protein